MNGVVDLRGGAADGGFTCNSCHAGPGAPQFYDLHGNSDPHARTVGAHQAHLHASKYRGPLGCEECHVVPQTVTSPGHLGAPPAPTFNQDGGVAFAGGAHPSYAAATATCTNVACHGAGLLAQDQASWLNRTPVWNGPSSQVSCGTCHSLPPLDGRPEHDGGIVLGCAACHGRSIDSNGALIFHLDDAGVRRTEHLDGVVTGN
jgi:predicted CxxxxCH...CXXCH cytochrome family protein